MIPLSMLVGDRADYREMLADRQRTSQGLMPTVALDTKHLSATKAALLALENIYSTAFDL
jgi:hypothetical protein